MTKKHFIITLILCAMTLQLQAQQKEGDYKFISFNIRLGSEWARQYDVPCISDHYPVEFIFNLL